MNESGFNGLEKRSRELFDASVEDIDMRVRSRLTQARHAALEAVAARPSGFFRATWVPSAAGITAAAVLAVALWFGAPHGSHGTTAADPQASFEDLDIVAASDENSGDPMEMLQDDVEFYDWAAQKTADSDPATDGVG
jgi:hypothetical protein